MDALRQLLECPACGGALSPAWSCGGCSAAYLSAGGVPDLRIGGDRRTDVVRCFYGEAPFPGYRDRDTLTALRARAERS